MNQCTKAKNKSTVALKAFFKITEKWELSSEQEIVLLGVPRSTFYAWKKQLNGVLPKDTFERISYILGIYKALRILLPNEEMANKWIRKNNSAPIFGGHCSLDKLTKGHVVDLADVRRYLDQECGC